jgi:hypothetical protein
MHGLEIKTPQSRPWRLYGMMSLPFWPKRSVGAKKELLSEIERLKGLNSAKPSAGAKAKPKYRKGTDEW